MAFAKRWKSLSGEGARETRLKSQFLFNMLLVDRPPADWVIEALTGFAQERKDPGFAALVRGYAAFKRGDHAKGERLFREVASRYAETDAGPEALYWAGVSKYRATNDPAALKETAAAFNARYTESAWAKKASVWQ